MVRRKSVPKPRFSHSRRRGDRLNIGSGGSGRVVVELETLRRNWLVLGVGGKGEGPLSQGVVVAVHTGGRCRGVGGCCRRGNRDGDANTGGVQGEVVEGNGISV